MHGNDSWWCVRDSVAVDVSCLILSFVIQLSSLQLRFVSLFLSFSQFVILAKAGNHRTASVVARYYHFVTGIVVGFALCCCLLWQMRFQTRHPACVDEWIPVCTGMTIGGVAAVSEFSSLQLIFVRLFLSVFYLVILADAGIHRTASVVARYYRFVTGIVVGFALCSCWLWQVSF